ncbi:MAG: trehalose-6-phosphate synthase [Acidimicrobiales bacterium]
MATRRELVVAACSLPFKEQVDTGENLQPSRGGLANAVVPSMRGLGAGWVGAGTDDRADGEHGGLMVNTAVVSPEDYELFYNGFSNSTIWPLFHDNIRPPQFCGSSWRAYQSVNEGVADRVASLCQQRGRVWVHDYQLLLVPGLLRKIRPDVRIGYFHHIPFPPLELFAQLPWRDQLLHGLLSADLVGFQTADDAENFVAAARRFVRARGSRSRLRFGGREVEIGVFPITVDTNKIRAVATSAATQRRARELRLQLGRPDTVLLGVDRLDYSKGIDQRLLALQQLLRRGALDPARCVMIQVGVPSRGAIGEYAGTRERIEQLVGEINGEFATVGHPIVHNIHRSVPFEELVALYRAADVMLVTPLRDGMNLVAKEYVASRVDSAGALVLSEFAGAAHELTAAYIVNPHDLDSLTSGIEAAVKRNPVEHARRMRSLQKVVLRHDVHYWASSFLSALGR